MLTPQVFVNQDEDDKEQELSRLQQYVTQVSREPPPSFLCMVSEPVMPGLMRMPAIAIRVPTSSFAGSYAPYGEPSYGDTQAAILNNAPLWKDMYEQVGAARAKTFEDFKQAESIITSMRAETHDDKCMMSKATEEVIAVRMAPPPVPPPPTTQVVQAVVNLQAMPSIKVMSALASMKFAKAVKNWRMKNRSVAGDHPTPSMVMHDLSTQVEAVIEGHQIMESLAAHILIGLRTRTSPRRCFGRHAAGFHEGHRPAVHAGLHRCMELHHHDR